MSWEVISKGLKVQVRIQSVRTRVARASELFYSHLDTLNTSNELYKLFTLSIQLNTCKYSMLFE